MMGVKKTREHQTSSVHTLTFWSEMCVLVQIYCAKVQECDLQEPVVLRALTTMHCGAHDSKSDPKDLTLSSSCVSAVPNQAAKA